MEPVPAKAGNPVAARFLSTDPIGYQDQLNLYAYVGNDPVNKTDPTGEQICKSCSGSSTDGFNIGPNRFGNMAPPPSPPGEGSGGGRAWQPTEGNENGVGVSIRPNALITNPLIPGGPIDLHPGNANSGFEHIKRRHGPGSNPPGGKFSTAQMKSEEVFINSVLVPVLNSANLGPIKGYEFIGSDWMEIRGTAYEGTALIPGRAVTRNGTPVTSYRVRVVLLPSERNPGGWYVHTAFPIP